VGTAKLIEEILRNPGKDVELAREGVNNWAVKEGTAKIRIVYNPENFFVAGDAYLCQLPSGTTRIKSLYQFLLQENFLINGLVLSCVNQNIVLSRIMYDLDITRESGAGAFKQLFRKSDDYDDLLKRDYGCLDRLEE
jgi:serine protease Do